MRSIFKIGKLNLCDLDTIAVLFPIDDNVVCLNIYSVLFTAEDASATKRLC